MRIPHLSRPAIAVLTLILLAMFLPDSTVAEEEKPDTKSVAEVLVSYGIPEEDIARLKENKVLMSGVAHKQMYDAYKWHGIPLFITSDSILNAYNVLMLKSVEKLERANAKLLPDVLNIVFRRLELIDNLCTGDKELVSAAKERSRMIIAVALKLLGEDARIDAPADKLVDEEIARVEKAEVCLLLEWIATPGAAFNSIDYGRFKPRGFYSKSVLLSRYFRAVSYLQAIPFRASVDKELAGALMLGHTLLRKRFKSEKEYDETVAFFGSYGQFIGRRNNWDILKAAQFVNSNVEIDLSPSGLESIRNRIDKYAEEHGGENPIINDLERLAPANGNIVQEPNFRVVSMYVTPDAVLFQRTTDLRAFPERSFPNGLEVAMVLGSEFARGELEKNETEKLLETVEAAKKHFKASSLYCEYMNCLGELLDEPDEKAPELLNSEPWRVKSCQTALAGWAQMKHTWILHSTMVLRTKGKDRIKVNGFIEPEPDFFERFAALVDRTIELFGDGKALKTNPDDLKEVFRKGADILEKHFFPEVEFVKSNPADWPADELALADEALHTLSFWGTLREILSVKDTEDVFADAIKWLRKFADNDPPLSEETKKDLHLDLLPKWRKLSRVLKALQFLLSKQLEGEDFSEEENDWIKHYGGALKSIMCRGGRSEDDAPVIADVYRNPIEEKPMLLVGVARPRTLWVLYPYEGKEVLCKGAVMPYYEFKSKTRLTDGKWKDLLDSDNRPRFPRWLKPIIGAGPLRKPKVK